MICAKVARVVVVGAVLGLFATAAVLVATLFAVLVVLSDCNMWCWAVDGGGCGATVALVMVVDVTLVDVRFVATTGICGMQNYCLVMVYISSIHARLHKLIVASIMN